MSEEDFEDDFGEESGGSLSSDDDFSEDEEY